MINNVTKNPKNNKLEINSIEIWLSCFHKNLKQKQGCNLVPKLVIHFNEYFVNFCHTVLYLQLSSEPHVPNNADLQKKSF